jgi:hypothetical protein
MRQGAQDARATPAAHRPLPGMITGVTLGEGGGTAHKTFGEAWA